MNRDGWSGMATESRRRSVRRPTDREYGDLLAFRTALRRFEQWSQEQARAAGLTPAQHQLLLAVRGHDDSRGPTIGEIADYLVSQHHSVVGLVDRAAMAGLVVRVRDSADGRLVRVKLTRQGKARIDRLSTVHLHELQNLAPVLDQLALDVSADANPGLATDAGKRRG